jgi:hypothetical protein
VEALFQMAADAREIRSRVDLDQLRATVVALERAVAQPLALWKLARAAGAAGWGTPGEAMKTSQPRAISSQGILLGRGRGNCGPSLFRPRKFAAVYSTDI